MSRPLVVALPGDEELAAHLAAELHADIADTEIRSFPDEETYLRIDSPVSGRAVAVVASLARPNSRTLPTLLLASTLRDLSPASLGLITPYLAYMRQDARFRPGEGITSRYFGALISNHFDWLVTVDPHLHRVDTLEGTYTIPHTLVSSAEPIARWISEEIHRPLLVGPDEESAQWIAPIATAGGFPTVILEKERTGDFDVQVSELSAAEIPADDLTALTPILIDDIISTGRTMIEAIKALNAAGLAPPTCLGIHGLFVDDAREALRDAGAARIVTCNTIDDPTNAIDLWPAIASATAPFL